MQPSLLNTLDFHLKRLPGAAESEREHDRKKIAQAVERLLAGKAGTRDELVLQKRLPALALAVAEDRLPADYELLLRDLETCRRTRPKDAPSVPTAVEQVAARLRGRALVVVGGIPKPEHKEKLRESFELSEVVWPATNEHAPDVGSLEPEIARADVVAVVLLIRFIRHAMNDLADTCKRHGKPLVRAPGGYNVKQIAEQVLEQVSKRLDGGA